MPTAIHRVPVLIPALLLIYAVARLLDGRDGDYGPGVEWTVGHLAFLGAFIGFGILTTQVRNQFEGPRPAMVEIASTAALIGVALFCGVIVTDLVPTLDERAALPDPVMMVGPAVFIGGFVGLLALAARRLDSVGTLTPLLTLVALVVVGVNLDLLALTAALLLVALRPLRRQRALEGG